MAEPSLRDRALAAIDDAIVATIGKEATTAWSKDAGGEKVAQAVREFAVGLPLLLELRRQMRAAVTAAMSVPPAGATS
jgi:hypothetical protein